MLDLSTAFHQRLAAQFVDDAFMLATIEGVGVPTQYLSLGRRTLTWGASNGQIGVPPDVTLFGDRETYAASDGAVGVRRDTVDSEPPITTISLTNLDDSWTNALHRDALDYNGMTITFKLVFASVDPVDILDSLKSRITDGPYMISGSRLTDNGVEFSFGANFNALKLRVPALLSRARRCQFKYKGPNCLSTSTLPACGKTPGDCAARHGNVLRFSSWPFSNREFF